MAKFNQEYFKFNMFKLSENWLRETINSGDKATCFNKLCKCIYFSKLLPSRLLNGRVSTLSAKGCGFDPCSRHIKVVITDTGI